MPRSPFYPTYRCNIYDRNVETLFDIFRVISRGLVLASHIILRIAKLNSVVKSAGKKKDCGKNAW